MWQCPNTPRRDSLVSTVGTSLATFDLHCSHTYMCNLVLRLQHIDIALWYTLTPRLISALDNYIKMQREVGTKSCNSCTSVILRISCLNLGTGYVFLLRSPTLLVFSTFSYSRCYITYIYNCSENSTVHKPHTYTPIHSSDVHVTKSYRFSLCIFE